MQDKAQKMFAKFDMPQERRDICSLYFSHLLIVADSMTAAVIQHLAEASAADPSSVMPDVSDPTVIVRTVLDFFGGKIGDDDGLELVLLPANSPFSHPAVKNGTQHKVCANGIRNAMNLMVRVPMRPIYGDGRVRNFKYIEEFFFSDAAGLDHWLAAKAARNWQGSGSGMVTL